MVAGIAQHCMARACSLDLTPAMRHPWLLAQAVFFKLRRTSPDCLVRLSPQDKLSCEALTTAEGGSWLTGSLYFNSWPTVPDMVFGNGGNMSGWLLDLALATPDGDNLFDDLNQDFFGSMLWSVEAKAYKGM